MDEPFWNDRWNKNEIAFHQSEGNPLLPKHFKELALPKNARIFVPLCGKTGDLIWLHSRGYQVVGVEWVEAAVGQFYDEHGMTPTISQKNGSLHALPCRTNRTFCGRYLRPPTRNPRASRCHLRPCRLGSFARRNPQSICPACYEHHGSCTTIAFNICLRSKEN